MSGLVVGCAPNQQDGTLQPKANKPGPTTRASSGGDPVVATVGSTTVTREELLKPLMEGYGFKVLLVVIQHQLAQDECRAQGMDVTTEDIAKERAWTLEYGFGKVPAEEREQYLEQFFLEPRTFDKIMTRAEYDLIVETNAYARKIATKALTNSISDEQLQQEFDRRYGAKAQVRFIMVANPQDLLRARERVEAGESFADVAKQVSKHPESAARGGALPPFTNNDTRLPENFRNTTFALKAGEMSDAVQVDGSYCLILREATIPPKVQKFEDVKESLREAIQNDLIVQGLDAVKARLGMAAMAQLKVQDPTLDKEFQKRLQARNQASKAQMKSDWEKQRAAATQPATKPTTRPGNTGKKPPATTPAGNNPAGPAAPVGPDVPAEPAATAPGAAAAPNGAPSTPAPATAPTTRP